MVRSSCANLEYGRGQDLKVEMVALATLSHAMSDVGEHVRNCRSMNMSARACTDTDSMDSGAMRSCWWSVFRILRISLKI